MKILRHLPPLQVKGLVEGTLKLPPFDGFIHQHGGVIGVEDALRDERYRFKYWNVLEQSPESWLPDSWVAWELEHIPIVVGARWPWGDKRKLWSWPDITSTLARDIVEKMHELGGQKPFFLDQYWETPRSWMFDAEGVQLRDLPLGFSERWEENIRYFRSRCLGPLVNGDWQAEAPVYLEHAGGGPERQIISEQKWHGHSENVLSVYSHEPYNVGWALQLALNYPEKWIAFTNQDTELVYRLAGMLRSTTWHAWV